MSCVSGLAAGFRDSFLIEAAATIPSGSLADSALGSGLRSKRGKTTMKVPESEFGREAVVAVPRAHDRREVALPRTGSFEITGRDVELRSVRTFLDEREDGLSALVLEG